MTHDAPRSADASAKTSAAETEAAYLARQSDDARAAIRRALDDLQVNVRGGQNQAADLHGWVERHPWVVVGAASAAGFLAAIALTPAPGQSLGEKWSHTFGGLAGAAAGEQPATNGHATAPQPAPSHSPLWGMLLGPLANLAKVALENYLMAAMAGQAAAESAADVAAEPPHQENRDSAAAPDQAAASTGGAV